MIARITKSLSLATFILAACGLAMTATAGDFSRHRHHGDHGWDRDHGRHDHRGPDRDWTDFDNPPFIGPNVPIHIKGNGTYAGSISVVSYSGNGTYAYLSRSGVGVQTIAPPPTAKIIHVSPNVAAASCSMEAGVCVIRP
ncbi:hypothetical protein [Rhizobium sp. NRK18]|uniref:hypothetical protein n=1 Tax=Rhizobium sp. NRK18 TaxID=2964667 RepID=UPI0021C49C55|nr:hypothetical protein [Rhizobium sp. NRK18]MCQ2002983.1 hypothetical protein [Rhizobium sp. NRK18]